MQSMVNTQFTKGNNLELSQTTFIYKSSHTSPLTNSYYNTLPSLYSFTVFHTKVISVTVEYKKEAKNYDYRTSNYESRKLLKCFMGKVSE